MKDWLKSFYSDLKQEMPTLKMSMIRHPKFEGERVEIDMGECRPTKKGWLLELFIRYFPGPEESLNKGVAWSDTLKTALKKLYKTSNTEVVVRRFSFFGKPLYVEGHIQFKHVLSGAFA